MSIQKMRNMMAMLDQAKRGKRGSCQPKGRNHVGNTKAHLGFE